MQKILSLDIDYIMAPSIHVYDDWVDGHWVNPAIQWEMIKKKMGVEPISCPKRESYLLKIFKKALTSLDSPDQIVFARDHHKILESIGKSQNLIIDNVDHHHDIYYAGWNKPQDLNEGNWVWWLDNSNQLEEYTWFGNKNSETYDNSMPFHCHYRQIFDRRYHPMSKPDFIFVCESPHWVPPDSRTLFSTMHRMANNYFKGVRSIDENINGSA